MNDQQQAVFWRAVTTMTIWALLLVAIIIVSIFLPASLGEDIIAVYLFLAIAGAVSTGAVWSSNNSSEKTKDKLDAASTGEIEKRKNDRLASALQQLSDDELVSLRERINRGEVDERQLATLFDDD